MELLLELFFCFLKRGDFLFGTLLDYLFFWLVVSYCSIIDYFCQLRLRQLPKKRIFFQCPLLQILKHKIKRLPLDNLHYLPEFASTCHVTKPNISRNHQILLSWLFLRCNIGQSHRRSLRNRVYVVLFLFGKLMHIPIIFIINLVMKPKFNKFGNSSKIFKISKNYLFDKIKAGSWFAFSNYFLVFIKNLLFQTSNNLHFMFLRQFIWKLLFIYWRIRVLRRISDFPRIAG